MTKTLKILAIDDEKERLEQELYKPLRKELNKKGLTLEYKIVSDFEEAIGELNKGYYPDAITCDYIFVGGENGISYLSKVIDRKINTTPDYKPRTFILTRSTNNADIDIYNSSILHSYDTEAINKGDICRLIEHFQYPDVYPIKLKNHKFIEFLNEHSGIDIVSEGKVEEKPVKNKIKDDSGLLNADLGDGGEKIKSLLPNISDEEHRGAYRVDCLKSNNIPVKGYAAFNEQDIDKLLSEGKKPILFIDDYNPKIDKLLTKISGVVCLNIGGSHLLERGIPVVSESDKETWNKEAGEGINYYRIEQVDGKSVVANNSHAVKKAIHDWQRNGEDINNTPQPEYDNPQKNKTILFRSGDKVTLARNAAYQGHLKIEYPDVSSTVDFTNKVEATLPLKPPKFLATLNSATDLEQGNESITAAKKLGAQGVGLVRSEHMYDDKVLAEIKEAILEDSCNLIGIDRAGSFGNNGLNGIISYANDKNLHDREPLRIRLFDFPPNEFFSTDELEKLKVRVGDEVQGASLALKTKGIYEEQLLAIFDSVKNKNFERKKPINLQIMAPHVSSANEMKNFIDMVHDAARYAMLHRDNYEIGAMIETKSITDPKELAKLAKMVDFVSFGTNDLTQEITGIKRPFAGGGMNPYEKLDDKVKDVMRESVEILRENNPNIVIGCCGAQMKDLDSLTFAAKDLKLDDVSMPSDAKHLIGRRLQLYQRLSREQDKQPKTTIQEITSVSSHGEKERNIKAR